MNLKSDLTLSGLTLLPGGEFAETTLQVADGKIVDLAPGLDAHADFFAEGYLIPGFIDLQINGAFGYDFTTDGGGVMAISESLPQFGVTAFLPTIITSPFENYPIRLREIGTASREAGGARPLGVHLEGPYLNPARVGAHSPEWLRPINLPEIRGWAFPSIVRLVTLAPELPGALEAIHYLQQRGIVVSAGHSEATFAEAMAAFEAGVGWGTHLFNAMSSLHHRAPGLAGALLTSPIPCGLIADGIHVHPTMVKLAYQVKGAQGITLVTDAMAALGMSPGAYRLAGHEVEVSASRTQLADGTLAGSLLSMDAAVRNMLAFSGCTLAEAVNMASHLPASLLGLNHKGLIAAGCDADLVILDNTLHVTRTFVAGRCVFETSPLSAQRREGQR